MMGILKSRPRSKKAKRLGPARVMGPEQYEVLEVNSKLACIQGLIPLGLMRLHELLEGAGRTLAGPRSARKKAASCLAIGMGAIQGVCSWPGNAIRSRSRVSSAGEGDKWSGMSLAQDPRWMDFGHKKTSLIC